MEGLEQENQQLQDQVTALQANVAQLTAMFESLNEVRAIPLPPPPTQGLNVSVLEDIPVSASLFYASMPMPTTTIRYPWRMPTNFGETSQINDFGTQFYVTTAPQTMTSVPPPGMTSVPQTMASVPSPVMTVAPATMNIMPLVVEPIYHANRAESVISVGHNEEIQNQFDEIQRELRALRGKELFGKNAHDMCLVPDVDMPPKFKVPDFEKYKGDSCPQSHLIMYARKMVAHTKNDKLLIHCFQDSLTGAALKWYVRLDREKIQSFVDVCEAFMQQYKYNVDLAPDRDQLRSLSQKERESFKEYAQRWRVLAAQVNPPLDEKEMTKTFLKTLDPFYFDRMISSNHHDFTDVVETGVRMEEAIREGRLVKDAFGSGGSKMFGTGFGKKREQEVGMIVHGGPRGHYFHQPQQHVATIALSVNTGYQQRRQNQRPQNQRPQNQSQNLPQDQPQGNYSHNQGPPRYDPIPIKYVDLLPALLEGNRVQLKPPLPVPKILPSWYRADLTCAYHSGSPGHDIEHCYGLKNVVQSLIKNGSLKFKDTNPNVQANPLPPHGTAAVNMVQDIVDGTQFQGLSHGSKYGCYG